MKPQIYAKSAIKINNIKCKHTIGCDGIEIQLLSELKNNEEINLKNFENLKIKAVHVPNIDMTADVLIDYISNEEYHKYIRETCQIANYFGEKQEELIIVIIHSEIDFEHLMKTKILYESIKENIRNLLSEFPYIKIGIENVLPIQIKPDKDLRTCNNFKSDNIKLINKLKEDIGTERLGAVLDTCHAMMSEKYILALFKELNIEPKEYSLNEFFKEYKDTCILIHLSDFKKNGFGKEHHGIQFSKNTKEKCFEILDLYKKYNYTCPITLEVAETDYLKCDGYKNTKEIVDSYKWN